MDQGFMADMEEVHSINYLHMIIMPSFLYSLFPESVTNAEDKTALESILLKFLAVLYCRLFVF